MVSNKNTKKIKIDKSILLLPFYKVGSWIVEEAIHKGKKIKNANGLKRLLVKEQIIDEIKVMNPTDRELSKLKKYYVEKLTLVLIIIFFSNCLGFFMELSVKLEEAGVNHNLVGRLDYGNGKKEEELLVTIGDVVTEEPISIFVEGREYTTSELTEIFNQAMSQLDTIILGDNASKDEVRENLNLTDSIPGSSIKVRWELEDDSLVDNNGEIQEAYVREEGTLVKLKGILTLEDQECEYTTYVNILPRVETKSEKIVNELMDKIEALEEQTRTEESFELPLKVKNLNVIWDKKDENPGVILLVLGLITGIILYWGKDEEIHREVQKRNNQMILDYSDIVSKLTLLLGAGMTVKGAWQKIALDYKDTISETSGTQRYAYEEMLLTYYELQGGISEVVAYDRFGKRCKVQRYLKLSALLTQNLKKGSSGLAQMLSAEVTDAFEERKNQAKRIGEEAGTKLLLPMFLMLMIVLIIIIVPAFLSFYI